MSKRVLSVGQCNVDHGAVRECWKPTSPLKSCRPKRLRRTVTLEHEKFDLVMVNRKLDVDYSDGLEIIRRIKADPKLAATPCMLVTNYPEHQEAAVAAGAEPGFGKLAYDRTETARAAGPVSRLEGPSVPRESR